MRQSYPVSDAARKPVGYARERPTRVFRSASLVFGAGDACVDASFSAHVFRPGVRALPRVAATQSRDPSRGGEGGHVELKALATAALRRRVEASA